MDFSVLTSSPQVLGGSIHDGPTGRLSCLFSFCLHPPWPPRLAELDKVHVTGDSDKEWPPTVCSHSWCQSCALQGCVPHRHPTHCQQELLCYEMLRALPGNVEFAKQKLTMRAMSKFLQVFAPLKSSQEADPAVSAGQPTTEAARVGNCLWRILALER